MLYNIYFSNLWFLVQSWIHYYFRVLRWGRLLGLPGKTDKQTLSSISAFLPSSKCFLFFIREIFFLLLPFPFAIGTDESPTHFRRIAVFNCIIFAEMSCKMITIKTKYWRCESLDWLQVFTWEYLWRFTVMYLWTVQYT